MFPRVKRETIQSCLSLFPPTFHYHPRTTLKHTEIDVKQVKQNFFWLRSCKSFHITYRILNIKNHRHLNFSAAKISFLPSNFFLVFVQSYQLGYLVVFKLRILRFLTRKAIICMKLQDLPRSLSMNCF